MPVSLACTRIPCARALHRCVRTCESGSIAASDSLSLLLPFCGSLCCATGIVGLRSFATSFLLVTGGFRISNGRCLDSAWKTQRLIDIKRTLSGKTLTLVLPFCRAPSLSRRIVHPDCGQCVCHIFETQDCMDGLAELPVLKAIVERLRRKTGVRAW
jgi:hypothetical protein